MFKILASDIGDNFQNNNFHPALPEKNDTSIQRALVTIKMT
jgi:hypothetical protein